MDHSPLSRLPAELRNRIYELALHQDTPVRARFANQRPRLQFKYTDNALALVRSCKQIRAESAGLFCSANSFRIELNEASLYEVLTDASTRMSITLDPFTVFLAQLGPEKASLLNVVSLQLGETPTGSCKLRDDSDKGVLILLLRRVRRIASAYPTMRLTLHIGVETGFRAKDDMEVSIEYWCAEESLQEAIGTVREAYGKPRLDDDDVRHVEETLVGWQKRW
ncbi:hypothetical protein LTR85_009425 [Meristemomyces frigidus]|nr:hypothetical protein LTR85_009425 [Meristemomyces frigidus]